MCASFNDNSRTTIISCYRLTNPSGETDIITIYNELNSFVRLIPKHNVQIIDGDKNAPISKDENKEYCLHNSSNRI